ncbi:type VI secretion system tube protein Hcp [Aquincola tertiaricarbonis]|uniref:Type VI secretion system tube protein Hcp n=1 Tax=Aquincola tertiaricarbonis TaxID=391953 RepID=A0ABY4S649_AQUTE|nr:type VI secretion system tube protein Hcp [Aquincola tertiaricarbonis]URI08888.1 type VI secretion system tube protein Hcp [Aquincola tertiaricarbonis]
MAVDMFIQIGDIKGESTDKTNAEMIDVLAWSWGMSNSGTTHMGGGGGSGKANVQDLSFTKYIDSSSNALLKSVCEGTHHPKAKLIVRKAGGKPLDYVVLELEEVLVTSVSTGGSGGEDRLTENVSLNFAKFTYKYQPQDEKGAKKGGTKDYAYDIAGNAEA